MRLNKRTFLAKLGMSQFTHAIVLIDDTDEGIDIYLRHDLSAKRALEIVAAVLEAPGVVDVSRLSDFVIGVEP